MRQLRSTLNNQYASDTNKLGVFVRSDAAEEHVPSTALVALFLLYPLFRNISDKFEFIFPLSVLAGIVLVAKSFTLKIRLNMSTVAWCALILTVLGSFLILGSDRSLNPGRLVMFVLAWTLMITMGSRPEWFKRFFLVALAMLAIHAAATLLFMVVPGLYHSVVKPLFFSDAPNAVGHQSGLTSHYSYNGMLLSAGVIMSGAWMASSIDGERGLTHISGRRLITFILFILALLATSKRGPLLAVIVALSLSMLIASGKAKAWALMKIGAIFATACLLIAIAAPVVPQIGEVFERFTEVVTSSTNEDATNGRNLLWDRAIDLWKEKPITGNGWGTYRYYWEGRSDVVTRSAHNVYLNLLSDVGVIGFAVFLIAAVPPFIGLWKVSSSYKLFDVDSKMIIYFAFAYQIFFFIYCISGSPLYDIESYIFYMLFSNGVWFAIDSCLKSRLVSSRGVR